MRIIILGLRRSGTTAFWRTWRQDERFVCFDEPFNHFTGLVDDPSWRSLRYTSIEKQKLWERDPKEFWDHFVSIDRLGELRRGMSDHERSYLTWLLGSAEHVCIDFTRCHFKIADLKQAAPDAVLVHLRRPPQNWLTSIVFPSGDKLNRLKSRRLRIWRKFKLRTRNMLSRRTFWRAQQGFRSHAYEQIIGTGAHSLFGYRLRELGLEPESVCEMPLVGRLLALWKLYSEEVETEAPKHFGDRFLSVNFNTFCRSPKEVISQVYDRLGEEAPSFDFSGIRPPHAPFQPSAQQWGKLFDVLDIDKQWLADGREI